MRRRRADVTPRHYLALLLFRLLFDAALRCRYALLSSSIFRHFFASDAPRR